MESSDIEAQSNSKRKPNNSEVTPDETFFKIEPTFSSFHKTYKENYDFGSNLSKEDKEINDNSKKNKKSVDAYTQTELDDPKKPEENKINTSKQPNLDIKCIIQKENDIYDNRHGLRMILSIPPEEINENFFNQYGKDCYWVSIFGYGKSFIMKKLINTDITPKIEVKKQSICVQKYYSPYGNILCIYLPSNRKNKRETRSQENKELRKKLKTIITENSDLIIYSFTDYSKYTNSKINNLQKDIEKKNKKIDILVLHNKVEATEYSVLNQYWERASEYITENFKYSGDKETIFHFYRTETLFHAIFMNDSNEIGKTNNDNVIKHFFKQLIGYKPPSTKESFITILIDEFSKIFSKGSTTEVKPRGVIYQKNGFFIIPTRSSDEVILYCNHSSSHHDES